MDERSEAELVEEARRGGREAFAELVRRHERRVYGVVYRMAGNHSDADDLAQEAFLTAWKAIGSFRRGSSFYTWIYRIAVNASLTFLKKKGREKERTVFDESLAVAGPSRDRMSAPERELGGDRARIADRGGRGRPARALPGRLRPGRGPGPEPRRSGPGARDVRRTPFPGGCTRPAGSSGTGWDRSSGRTGHEMRQSR